SGLEKFSVKLWIDPFSRRSVERANNRLAAHHLILQVTRQDNRTHPYENPFDINTAVSNCQSSLCFRLLTPVIVSITSEKSTCEKSTRVTSTCDKSTCKKSTSVTSTCEESTSETSTTDRSTTETSTTDKSTTTKSTTEKSKSYADRFQDYVAL